MKRILSIFLLCAILSISFLPMTVTASESGNAGGWFELLEYSSINDDGSNWFSVSGKSGSFNLGLHGEKRLCKIDMVIWHQTAERISAASVTAGSSTSPLTVTYVGANISRVYGNIPNAFYEELVVTVNKTTSTNVAWELLSCRLTGVTTTDYVASARIFAGNEFTAVPGYYLVTGDTVDNGATVPMQTAIVVSDWQKFDTLTFVGSLDLCALNSVRVTIGSIGVPFEITFTSSNSTGSSISGGLWSEFEHYTYDESYKGTTESLLVTNTEYSSKTLYCVTCDLTGIDRTSKVDLYCYFTCNYNTYYGYEHQVVGATGSVITADTTNVTWWHRFTNFMTDLFGSDKGQDSLDDLQQSSSSISQGASDIHAFEQSQQAVLDTGMTTIQNAVSYTSFMAALVFVQKYANMTFDGISQYAIVFTLPLFLGLFFFLCSRIPGITRWKPRPPKSEGGDSP